MNNTVKIALFWVTFLCGIPLAQADLEGKPAPLIDGVGEFQGELTLVDFWASWCGPCQASFPWMNEMKKKYPSLTIIAVNLDENREDAEKFLNDVDSDFKIIFDPKGDLAEKYRVDGMPSSYLIDKNGNVVIQHVGFFSENTSDYEADIQRVLGGDASTEK